MSRTSSRKRVPRVVLDTKVWASAVVWGGRPARIVHLAEKGRIQILTSPDVLGEISRVLEYPRLKTILDGANARKDTVLTKIAEISHVVESRHSTRLIKEDPSDNRILDCAIEGKADYMISGDRHLLQLGKFGPVRIVNTSEFLSVMRQATRTRTFETRDSRA